MFYVEHLKCSAVHTVLTNRRAAGLLAIPLRYPKNSVRAWLPGDESHMNVPRGTLSAPKWRLHPMEVGRKPILGPGLELRPTRRFRFRSLGVCYATPTVRRPVIADILPRGTSACRYTQVPKPCLGADLSVPRGALGWWSCQWERPRISSTAACASLIPRLGSCGTMFHVEHMTATQNLPEGQANSLSG